MYLVSTDQLAALHIADLHRQAEREHLAGALRTGRRQARRRRAAWARWGLGQARPARA